MVRLTDRPDMTLDVYRGRKTTKQQLRKRKNIRNFSDPKNWDGVFWGPKMIKNVPDFACLQALSTCIISVLACKQK